MPKRGCCPFPRRLSFSTNAETKRLRQQELAKDRAEARTSKTAASGKERARTIEDSDGDSTDMEGASVASSFSEDEELEDGAGKTPRKSSMDDLGIGEEGEDVHLAKVHRLSRRRQLEADQEQQARKRKRLPTRQNDEQWDSGEDKEDLEGPEDEIEDNEEGEQSPRRNHIQKVNGASAASRAVHAPLDEEDDSESSSREDSRMQRPQEPRSTITTGARFGLHSPYAIVTQKKRSERLRLAREQIARLSTEIINDPELTLGLVRRLAVFAGPTVESPDDEAKKAEVDDAIQASAMLSLCAVFVDILPGYRIRNLSEAEQKERVNQELARRRDWEQGLVIVYRNYLELCERVARKASPLFTVSVKAMCILAVQAAHFNYRTNLMRSLVSCLSRKSWDQASQECSQALVAVLKSDRQGDVSLEIVRLLNRMIKERRFRVHASVLEILAHLRLRDELSQGKRADTTSASAVTSNTDVFNKKLKSKDIRKGKGEHLSKKGAKRAKELREIEDEMKEAEAEVNQEERERHQTETLKLLFVLYFSIIKAPTAPDALLVAALRGLRLFAHRINIEFFRDLLSVLRAHIRIALDLDTDKIGSNAVVQRNVDDNSVQNEQEGDDVEESGETEHENAFVLSTYNPSLALHCIVTSLELLNGQGEALNLDLSDIATELYTVMVPLCNDASIEAPRSAGATGGDTSSVAILLLRALHLALVAPPRHAVPIERLASFVVRMCFCALQMPPKTSLALLDVSHLLVRRNDTLKTLVDNGDDRARNGHFDNASNVVDGLRPMQAGSVLWPLTILQDHANGDIASRARAIADEA